MKGQREKKIKTIEEGKNEKRKFWDRNETGIGAVSTTHLLRHDLFSDWCLV
jgi:hypothetical protein